ncbi:MAG: co-chaperone DjlA [Gammaproteobacteria bacterium]|nr:co-chaperone DjlA [Gammaproteobacteria bacterium]MYD79242.1 co-chaperone DjlA [Gammaproteobacteria bacterium]
MRYFTAVASVFLSLFFFGFWGLAVGIFVASAVLAFAPRNSKSQSRFQSGERFRQMGWGQASNPFEDHQEEHVEITDIAFRSFFQIAGYIAKSDGRISSEEIQLASQVMERLSLTMPLREVAIQCFNEGKSPRFNLDRTLDQIRSRLGLNRVAGAVLFEAMVEMSEADGLTQDKVQILFQYAQSVGIRPHEAQEYIAQRSGRSYSHSSSEDGERQTRAQTDSPHHALSNAYRILGVESSESDSKVKMAYRRLIQESHPDRLHAMNLPDFLMDAAHKKTQEIQAAWETVKQARGIT